jgi:hypothetical protein
MGSTATTPILWSISAGVGFFWTAIPQTSKEAKSITQVIPILGLPPSFVQAFIQRENINELIRDNGFARG